MTLFAALKAKTSKLRFAIWNSNKLGYRILRPIYASFHFCRMFFFSAEYRHQTWAHLRYGKHFHQPPNFTMPNRYPALFKIAQDYFAGRSEVKLLSFGCSTGEEAYSLREYLPQALIVGTDISPYNLKRCLQKPNSPKISFVHSLSEEFTNSGDFDAIFCLAVLQHTHNRSGVVKAVKYTFAQFEAQCLLLDGKLKSGGLMFIDHSDFKFLDTSIRAKYFPLQVPNNKLLHNRPLFNTQNEMLSESHESYRVFLKK